MWVVGKLRGQHFEQLDASPSFERAGEAEAWAKDFLEANPGVIDCGLESLTWRRRWSHVPLSDNES